MRYLERRRELMRRLPDGPVLVRGWGPDGVNAHFVYLTGLSEPGGMLLLAQGGMRIGTGRENPGPDYVHGRTVQQLLLLPSADPLAARWGEDSAATVEAFDGSAAGFDAVLPAGRAEIVLGQILARASCLYLVRGAAPTLAGPDDDDSDFAAKVSRRFLGLQLRDGATVAAELRSVKDADEIAAVERALGVTAEAFEAAIDAVRPDVAEHAIEAEIARVYRRHGATHAFDPIVGAGDNALRLHYTRNAGALQAGGLVLVDSGASLGGYKADITRTFPVDGRFSERQREIYEAVLAAQLRVIDDCRPGALLGDLHARAWQSIDAAGYAEYFLHGTSHHLGLETHDVGDLHEPLGPGAVITVEPGIYVPGEAIGVRIEDDVLITDDGCRVLSEAIPKSVAALEARMSRR